MMEWLRQLSRAIEYIEDHLAGEVSYDEAARIACCSTYYFQRMFSYVAGISLSEYIRRRRMTAAAFDLQTGAGKVLEIGAKYGYVSPTSFNRAFQSVHGVSPTAARLEGTALNAYPRLHFSVSVSGSEPIQYRIEEKGRLRVVGVRTALREDVEQNFAIAPEFWQSALQGALFAQIYDLANGSPEGILGVTACRSNEIFYYIAAPTDREPPEGMLELDIPAATWAIFETSGPLPDSIQTVFRRFYTEWLPFSGFRYAELPDIEVYPMDRTRMDARSEVWIAVKK